MKTIVAVVVLLIAFTVVAEAQVPPSFIKVWTGKTYAASQSDTSHGFYVAAASNASLYLKYSDSVNVITLIQYSKDGGTTWSFIMGDTLDQTGTGGGSAIVPPAYREVALRNGSTEKFGGSAGLVRIVQKFQATLCGVTTPTYNAWFAYRP